MVLDINTGINRDVIPYVFPFADKMKKYIAEGDYQKAFERLVNNNSLEAEICRNFCWTISCIAYMPLKKWVTRLKRLMM